MATMRQGLDLKSLIASLNGRTAASGSDPAAAFLARRLNTSAVPGAPAVAYPMPETPLPADKPGPDVQYPGGIQNFWSNNGRTFNIPGAAALAERTNRPAETPKTGVNKGGVGGEMLAQLMAGKSQASTSLPSWFPAAKG